MEQHLLSCLSQGYTAMLAPAFPHLTCPTVQLPRISHRRGGEDSLVRVLIDEAFVVAEDFLQLVVRDGIRTPIVGTGHGFRTDKRINDSFLRGLNGCQEEGIDPVTHESLGGGNGWLAAYGAVAFVGATVRGRE